MTSLQVSKPDWLAIEHYYQITRYGHIDGWELLRDLSPSPKLFNWLKESGKTKTNMKKYINEFRLELESNPDAINHIKIIKTYLENGKSICVACYCLHTTDCHRQVLSEIIEVCKYPVVVLS